MSKLVLASFLVLCSIGASATHIRGGYIRVASTNGLTAEIELVVMTNTFSEIWFGEGELSFGDGTSTITPTTQSTYLPGPNIGKVVYTVTHTYATPGRYLISYLEPNLTGGILNMFNSVETRFHVETTFELSEAVSYSSPDFPADPIFIGASGRPFSFSSAALSSSNDQFHKYELVSTPSGYANFRLPENLKINENNGLITWDTMFEGGYPLGMFWVLIKITTYSSTGDNMGYILRATQIIVDESPDFFDFRSSITDPDNKIVVTEEEEKKIKLVLSGEPTDELKVDIFCAESVRKNISIEQYDFINGALKHLVTILTVATTEDIVTDLPYSVTVRGTAGQKQGDISFLYMTKDVELPVDEFEVVTGIEERSGLNVYPNPFQSQIFVDEPGSATLFNLSGQPLIQSAIGKDKPLETSGLPGGIYLLKITDGNGIVRNYKLIRN